MGIATPSKRLEAIPPYKFQELEQQIAWVREGRSHADLIAAVFRRNHELDGDGLLRRKPYAHYALRLAQIYQGPESGLTAELIESIGTNILSLPDDFAILCGHGPDTTVGRERAGGGAAHLARRARLRASRQPDCG